MDTLVWILICGALGLVFGSKLERAMEEECESGQYTYSRECCMQCPPGEGVVKECGTTQTECSQCLDSETFSEIYSHSERCQTCSECTGLMRMQTPCTDSNDAVCVCNYGYFMDILSGQCEPCTVCPRGQGVLMRCEYDHDTICEECMDDTFSDQESSLDPCLPCTVCEVQTETLIRNCTPFVDTLCHDPFAPTYPSTTASLSDSNPPFSDLDGLWSPSPGGDATTPKPSSPHFISRGLNENLIPIYCSILAAVVVGLLAYIIFKRLNSYKQNKQAANNRAATANQTPSPEGEKLHSDSGISVDSQSLQEQQAQSQTQIQAQAHTQLHAAEQIVVRVDGGVQPDSPPPQA
ncbi:tumor necrosis factor receptor superfamily member 16-like isoform X2 [Myxocyprinus asiaticus]|uniref:tumor necrosis factor receptor superfamily member 16-like isoform X1 n=1 Tax=Myxocyprinus asiaticus TaxID=70543 RepID=UPI00222213F3|nr:tumor necrosis factor receptor superfamily member 16-like isoform X1 [Myxocyprinus asiaticus]XP_051572963.1 tumor necrosis factor receptor superfamily member 16-like isoform X2 [Myxocyprinus asiaticus]